MSSRCAMRRIRSLLVFAVLALTPITALAGSSEDIEAVVDHWAAAFNSNDVDALVNLYAPDALLLGTAGLTLTEGTKAVRSYFARLAGSGGKVAIDNDKNIVLDDNVAYATGFYTFSAIRGGEMRKSPAGFTMVLIKRGNDWLIAHHHSSRRILSTPTLPTRRG